MAGGGGGGGGGGKGNGGRKTVKGKKSVGNRASEGGQTKGGPVHGGREKFPLDSADSSMKELASTRRNLTLPPGIMTSS